MSDRLPADRAAALDDIIAELDASFDQQTYNERQSGDDNFDAPDDKEYCVNITAKQLRRLGKAALMQGGVAQAQDGEAVPLSLTERYTYTGTTRIEHENAVMKAILAGRKIVGYCEVHMASHPVLKEILDVLHPHIVRGQKAFMAMIAPQPPREGE